MSKQRYEIGASPVPYWCRAFLMPYRKSDGTTGFEFWGKFKAYDLEPGDALIYDGYTIRVETKKRGRDVI